MMHNQANLVSSCQPKFHTKSVITPKNFCCFDARMKNRIREIRKSLGLTQEKFGDVLGITYIQVGRLERGERQLRETTMKEYAKKLNQAGYKDVLPWHFVTEPDGKDTSSLTPFIQPLGQVPIIGQVQAGVWLEAVQLDQDDWEYIQVPLSGRYKDIFALRVAGDSMNKVYLDGTIVIVVPLYEYVDQLQSGDRVIIQRSKKDGVCEATAKELEITKDGALLWPRSTNPRFQEAISIHWPYSEPQESKTETVEIRGVIVGSYRSEKRF